MKEDLLALAYTRYAKEIYFYLFSLCRNSETAQDIMQDVFIKAFLSLPDENTNLRSWLYTVAHNMFVNQIKSARREMLLDDIPELPDTGNLVDDLADRLEAETVYQKVLSLPELPRNVLLLQYYAGLPQEDVSKILGISHGNVRVLAHRAKRELKQMLEGKK